MEAQKSQTEGDSAPVTYVLRPGRKSDIPFIIKSWHMTLRHEHTFLDNDIFFPAYRQQMSRIIANSKVTVAANGDSIIGFSITSDPDVLHFVYVKRDFRHAGVGTDLISHLGDYPRYTTITKCGRWYLKLGHYDPQYWWRRQQPAIDTASLPTREE